MDSGPAQPEVSLACAAGLNAANAVATVSAASAVKVEKVEKTAIAARGASSAPFAERTGAGERGFACNG